MVYSAWKTWAKVEELKREAQHLRMVSPEIPPELVRKFSESELAARSELAKALNA
jgi:hypothetical protein